MQSSLAPAVASFQCAICKKIGYERWPDADEYEDRNGRLLLHSQLFPHNNWVCSKGCRSQFMFESATPEQQYALKRVEVALMELDQYLPTAQPVIEAGFADLFDLDKLKVCVDQTRLLIGVDAEPKWISENGEKCGDTNFIALVAGSAR